MRRRPPPEVDPDRLRSLLASARPRPDPPAPSGWIPAESPPPAGPTDGGWWDEPSTGDAGPERDAEEPPDVEGGAPGGSGRHRPPPRVLTVPVALRGARIAVSVRAVVAFLVLLGVAVVFFAVRVARADQAAAPQSVPAGEGVVGRTSVPAAFTAGVSGGASGGGTGASATASGAPAAASDGARAPARASPSRLIVVDVVGQVAHPGVVTVADGSRVVDVLAAAGGALPGADMPRLNLARIVVDGEQVVVPRPGETPPAVLGAGGTGSGSGGAPGGGGGAGSVGAGPGPATPVDLNTATLAALDTLPGVGPVLAQRILDWRGQHGRFSSVDELGEVSGIGEKLLEQIRPKVRV